MNVQEVINDYTVLHYVEEHESHFDEEDNEIVDIYLLSFSFYDCHYYVRVNREDIDENKNYNLLIEGDGKLFESFEDACQEDLWNLIKERCNDFDKWFLKMTQN